MKFKNVLFLTLSLCVLASSAFAKAGYDNFGVTVNDPGKLYSSEIYFKYNCVANDDAQKAHIFQAKRAGNLIIGSSPHNLICPLDGDLKHGLYAITIGLSKVEGGRIYGTSVVKLHQHANATLECEVSSFAHAVCRIIR